MHSRPLALAITFGLLWVSSLELQRSVFAQARATNDMIPGWGKPIDQDGDCTIRNEGGKLIITVPGTKHDLFYGATDPKQRFNAPRVLRAVEGDFVARVKVSGDWKLVPEGSYNGAGLLIWESGNQYLRLERNLYYRTTEPKGPHSHISPCYDHNQKRAEFKTSDKGFFTGRSTWLRIERTGNEITTSVSNDGNIWTQTGKLATEFPKRVAIGVFVINTSPLAYTAEFEDFKVLAE